MSKFEIRDEDRTYLGKLRGAPHYQITKLDRHTVPLDVITEVPVLSDEAVQQIIEERGKTGAARLGVYHKIRGLDDKLYTFRAVFKCGYTTQRAMCERLRHNGCVPVVAFLPVREPISRFMAATHTLRNMNKTDDEFVEYMASYEDPALMNVHLKPMHLFARGHEIIFPIQAYNDLFTKIAGTHVHRNARKPNVKRTVPDLTPENEAKLRDILHDDFIMWEMYKERLDASELIEAYHKEIAVVRKYG